MAHLRKTPASLLGEKCVSCSGSGSLARAKLVLDWEWDRNHVPGARKDPRNRAILCRLCEEAFRAHLGQAPMSPDLTAMVQLRKAAMDSLEGLRRELLRTLPQEDLFGSFGRVETKKQFRSKLEKGAR